MKKIGGFRNQSSTIDGQTTTSVVANIFPFFSYKRSTHSRNAKGCFYGNVRHAGI